MSAEIFDFPFHRVSTRYPEGASVQFGSSWIYTAKLNAPDQRHFELSFPQGMQYFLTDTQDMSRGDLITPDGTILNAQRPRTVILNSSTNREILPTELEAIGQRNILALEQFYQRHLQWDNFMYPHIVYGPIKCRVLEGFTTPRLLPDTTRGVVEGFSILFLEVF